MAQEAHGIVARKVRQPIICALLLLGPLGCAGPTQAAASPRFACSSALRRFALSLEGKGRLVSPSTTKAVFGRLDRQSHVEVRETNCGSSVISLRYVRPRRMQMLAWLKGASRDPRETQIGGRIGYIRNLIPTRWVGMGVTTHRLLLPDAWHDVPRVGTPPTFYLVRPPQPAVRDLTVRVVNQQHQRVYVEHWGGLLDRCPAGAQCPAPNTDPRFFARFTAVLRTDTQSGLPVSLVTLAQPRGRARGQFLWGHAEVVSQTTFDYGGNFVIGFVKG